MNNGNVNNNDKNNQNNVLAVSEFQGMQPEGSPVFCITEEDVWEAYRQCRKRKKSTQSAVLFRLNERVNIRNLWLDLAFGTYYPGTSIAFITEGREVFAADFRDRIVHTLLAMRITPLLEAQFVPTTWNCRKGKGVYWAVQNLREQIRKVSENYTKDAWIMTFDLSGFFMGIDREKAADRLCRFVSERYNEKDKSALLHYLRIIITHAPEKDCIRYGSLSKWDTLPKRKSLFYQHGLPIGDLLSQLDGNFELDIVDHFITRLFDSDRYVDDFALVSGDKAKLLSVMPVLRGLLGMTCGAKMNPTKFKIVHWSQGFKYLGVIIRGDKAYPSGKTVGKAYDVVRRCNLIKKKNENKTYDFIGTMNSYLGLMKHYDKGTTRKIVSHIDPSWRKLIAVSEDKILPRVSRRNRLRSELRAKRRYFNNLKYSINHGNYQNKNCS